MKGSRLTTGLFLYFAAISGCSSSSQMQETESGPPDAATSQIAILIDDRGLVARGLDDVVVETIEPAIRFGGTLWHSPDRQGTALIVKRGETSYLALVASDGTYLDLHHLTEEADYSVVWAPTSDSLLIGFRGPYDQGVAIYTVGSGNLADVGCSASNVALSWGRGDWFIVGDQTSQYVVERAGCGTIESVDARKMHEVKFGPNGDRVAYVLRELEYNSKAREYRPDSSLYVANSVGTDPVLVAGDRYRPHRPAWSPDAMSLAFDARLPKDPDRRLVSIYDVEDGRSAFLNPKAVDSKSSEWAPHWSPSGDAIAYQYSSKGKAARVSVRVLSNSSPTTIGEPGERFAGWLDGGRVILQGDGVIRIVDTNGKESLV
ncbi:MAG: TolB family protein, partial [Rhodothermia bacterium]